MSETSDADICLYLDKLVTQGKSTEARINHAVSRYGVNRQRVVRLENERQPLRRLIGHLATGQARVPDLPPNS